MKIYVDMDGTLADFDRHYQNTFGTETNKLIDNVDWKKIRESKNWFLNMPPMPDMWILWNKVLPLNPTILTGVPSKSVPEAAGEKRAWVDKNLGKEVPMIPCPSKDKSLYCTPGDLLIDDWEKYKHLWLNKGGIWITHKSALQTCAMLELMGL